LCVPAQAPKRKKRKKKKKGKARGKSGTRGDPCLTSHHTGNVRHEKKGEGGKRVPERGGKRGGEKQGHVV